MPESQIYLLFSHSVVSNSLRPHGQQQARFPFPSPSLGVCSNSCPLNQWCHPTISSLSPPSPPALHLSQHQGLFQWVGSSHQVAKVLKLQFQHQSNFTNEKNLLQLEFSKTEDSGVIIQRWNSLEEAFTGGKDRSRSWPESDKEREGNSRQGKEWWNARGSKREQPMWKNRQRKTLPGSIRTGKSHQEEATGDSWAEERHEDWAGTVSKMDLIVAKAPKISRLNCCKTTAITQASNGEGLGKSQSNANGRKDY